VKGSSRLDSAPKQVWAEGLEGGGVHSYGLCSLKQGEQSTTPENNAGVGCILHEDVKCIVPGATGALSAKRTSEEDFLLRHLTLVPEEKKSLRF